MPAVVRFHGDLIALLVPRFRREGRGMHDAARRAAVKDVIEAMGVPHTEVYRLQVGQREVSFAHIPSEGEEIDVYPAAPPVDVGVPTMLRPEPFPRLCFIVDVNVAKLAGILRLLGFDTAYDPALTDGAIAERGKAEQRIVISRDRHLLRRRAVVHGRLVRAQHPREQAAELAAFFGLGRALRPFTRCSHCNGLLRRVDKKLVVERLEPLTRRYFDDFKLCGTCNQIYWEGSHAPALKALVAEIRFVANPEPNGRNMLSPPGRNGVIDD